MYNVIMKDEKEIKRLLNKEMETQLEKGRIKIMSDLELKDAITTTINLLDEKINEEVMYKLKEEAHVGIRMPKKKVCLIPLTRTRACLKALLEEMEEE